MGVRVNYFIIIKYFPLFSPDFGSFVIVFGVTGLIHARYAKKKILSKCIEKRLITNLYLMIRRHNITITKYTNYNRKLGLLTKAYPPVLKSHSQFYWW